MAIVQDGSQKFGIAANKGFVKGPGKDQIYQIESFSKTDTSTRVDIDNSDGEPLGSTTVPGRVEFSASIQTGAITSSPKVGDPVSFNATTTGSFTPTSTYEFLLTEVSPQETQAEYQRINISGFKAANTQLPFHFSKVSGGVDYACTSQSIVDLTGAEVGKLTSVGTATITTALSSNQGATLVAMSKDKQASGTRDYVFVVSTGGATADSGNSVVNSGVTIQAMTSTGVTLRVTNTVTMVNARLKWT